MKNEDVNGNNLDATPDAAETGLAEGLYGSLGLRLAPPTGWDGDEGGDGIFWCHV
jgi:hypothetical protein